MSMYCEVLCIRLPIDDDVIQIMKSKLIELGVINSDALVDRRDIIDQYIEIIYEKSDNEHFRKVGCSYSDRYYGYLDYVLKAEHDSDDGEFGRVRELYPEEIVSIANMRIYEPFNLLKLRLVQIRWYNCSEAPDYYIIEEDDPFTASIVEDGGGVEYNNWMIVKHQGDSGYSAKCPCCGNEHGISDVDSVTMQISWKPDYGYCPWCGKKLGWENKTVHIIKHSEYYQNEEN